MIYLIFKDQVQDNLCYALHLFRQAPLKWTPKMSKNRKLLINLIMKISFLIGSGYYTPYNKQLFLNTD